MTFDLGALAPLGTFIAAIGAVVIGWRNSRKADTAREQAIIAAERATVAKEAAEQSKAEIVKVGDGVYEVGKRIDGRLTELLDLTAKSAHAAGVLEGRGESKT